MAGAAGGETVPVIVPFARVEELEALEGELTALQEYVDGLVISGGGSVVQDSLINGNIKVNNAEVIVYDESAILARIEALETTGGVIGADGKSAYEIWLDAGHSGTEADFLTSLVGAQGPQGLPGTGGGSGVLVYQTLADLQTAYPNGINQPAWVVADNAWYYWSVTADTTAPTVAMSPSAGTYNSTQSVTLTANETATIYYTTDGSTPTTASTVYSTAISVSATTTLKYFAKDTAGNSSTVQTAVFTIDSVAPVLTITAGGTFTGTKSVTMSVNETADIYYTLDGSTPTASSTKYTNPLSISATTTIKSFAKDTAGNSSAVQTVTYTLDTTQPADTTAPNNVTNLAYSNVAQTTLTLTWAASTSPDVASYDVYNGATLLANVTGTTYNVSGLTASTQYTFAVKAKDAANNVASGTSVTVTTSAPADTTAPTVTASPAAGTFTSTQSVTLTANETATIYYTTNGTTPTTASTVYTGPISISATTTLQFIARDTAGNQSTAQTALYTINIDTTAPVITASPVAGTYTSAQSITLTANETATIYYTTDGTTPTTSSTVYSSPIPINSTTTLQFIGRDTAGNISTPVATTYTINLPVVLASDDFNRVDATTLGTSDSYAGGTNLPYSLSGTGAVFSIVSNQAKQTGGSACSAVLDVSQSDVTVQVTLGVQDSGGNYGCVARWDTTNHSGIVFHATNKKIYTYVSGGYTSIGDASQSFVAGDVVKMTLKGQNITLYRNGTQVATATTVVNQTATKHGIGSFGASTATWDNLIIASA
jgi:hypothetical protein